MYRYEVTATVKSDIEGVVGKPLFYDGGGKYYINDPTHTIAIQYWDSVTDSFLSKTLDQICNDLYSDTFANKSTQSEYHEIQHVQTDSTVPFAAKNLPDGKKLFARTHGKKFTLTAGSNTIDFDIPYAQAKLTGLEIINGEAGDNIDFFILDDDVGTYSTVPNYVLNQFGYDVNVPKDYYVRESNYDADLYLNMCISMAYYSESAKDVYINYILHEVKT